MKTWCTTVAWLSVGFLLIRKLRLLQMTVICLWTYASLACWCLFKMLELLVLFWGALDRYIVFCLVFDLIWKALGYAVYIWSAWPAMGFFDLFCACFGLSGLALDCFVLFGLPVIFIACLGLYSLFWYDWGGNGLLWRDLLIDFVNLICWHTNRPLYLLSWLMDVAQVAIIVDRCVAYACWRIICCPILWTGFDDVICWQGWFTSNLLTHTICWPRIRWHITWWNKLRWYDVLTILLILN